jgi:hypothetical protein
MTVMQFNGNVGDFSIGLIATSKHQSGEWNMRHQPKMDWVSDPSQSSSESQGQLTGYMQSQLGLDSNRWQRGSVQFTGHTALFVRSKGNAAWSMGWVPKPGPGNYFQALVMGSECVGEWRDDLSMINDPTCVSVEFPVSQPLTEGLISFFHFVKDRYTHYSFSVGASGHCNCVWAAVEVLRDYALLKGLGFAQRLTKVQDPLQGHMMQKVLGGELLMD